MIALSFGGLLRVDAHVAAGGGKICHVKRLGQARMSLSV
jgi:hypothetical protein